MDAYIKVETMEYPRFIGDIQLEVPGWSEDQPLPLGWSNIKYEPFPNLEPYTTTEVLPAELQQDGTWLVKWATPRPMTEEERLAYDEAVAAQAALVEVIDIPLPPAP